MKTFEGALGKVVAWCDISSKLATNCFLDNGIDDDDGRGDIDRHGDE